jgi:hypothetical protein
MASGIGKINPNGFLCRKWYMRNEKWLGGQVEFGKGETPESSPKCLIRLVPIFIRTGLGGFYPDITYHEHNPNQIPATLVQICETMRKNV